MDRTYTLASPDVPHKLCPDTYSGQPVTTPLGKCAVANVSKSSVLTLTSPSTHTQSLATRTTTPRPVQQTAPLSWDAQSYQRHSSSQACDSAGLVNFLISNDIVPPPVSRICDLGCGTGQNMISYQRAFNAEVYGADPSETMCAQAQASLSAQHMPVQCRGAEDFSFDVAFPLILSTHALHWIAKPAMPNALTNIHAQLTTGGTFAAVFAASKTGLPFDDALQSVKAQEKYRTAFSDFTLNQYFYSATEMETLLQQAQFRIHTLAINPVHKTFSDHLQLLGFVRQWLSEYKHLQQNHSTLAEDFLGDVINSYLTRTAQQPDDLVKWQERTFTLVASRNEHN